MLKQYNIFGEIDNIDSNGEIKRCCICGCSLEIGQLCLKKECAEMWEEKYFSINALKD